MEGAQEMRGHLGTEQPLALERWGEAGGDWGSVAVVIGPPPHPCTHLLLNVRQRLDGKISKGREGLVGRGGSVLGLDPPHLEPTFPYLQGGHPSVFA